MRVNIIDGDSIIFYCIHQKKDEPEKTLPEIKKKVDNFIYHLLNKTNSTHYILYLTVGENKRKEINPEYKANRKDLIRPKFFDEIKEYLITHHKASYFYGYEADDLCLTTKNYFDQGLPIEDFPHYEPFISSPDKDILNLEGTHYNYQKEQWIETSETKAHEYFFRSMITGDQTDGIKGIPGKGDKYVDKIFKYEKVETGQISLPSLVLEEYINHFGEHQGIEEFYKNYKSLKILDSIPRFTPPEPIEFKVKEEGTESTSM